MLVIGVFAWRPVKERIDCRTNQPKYLIDAINIGNYWKVKLYIDSGGDINKLEFYPKNKPFYVSVSGDSYYITDQDRFALGEAAASMKPEIVKYLLMKGANPDFSTRSGTTALHQACRSGVSSPVVRLLLDHGANINAIGSGGLTPLDLADISRTDVVAFLLDKGALLGGKKITVEEARDIQMAPYDVQIEAGSILKVNRNQTLNQSDTLNELLCKAVKGGAIKTAEMLLKRGANPNTLDKVSGMVPLMLIVMPNGRFPDSPSTGEQYYYGDQRAVMASLLIRCGAKLNLSATNEDKTLLHAACFLHDVKLAEVLLKAGADPNAKDKFGRTPYSYLIAVEEEVR